MKRLWLPLLLLVLGSAAMAQEQEWTIREVVLPSSLSREAKATARRVAALEPGQKVGPAAIDDALRRIFSSHRFDPRAGISLYQVAGGVRVELSLKELPMVEMVDIWGASEGPRDRAEELVRAWQGRGLYLPRLKHDERRLRGLYGLSAYPFAQIKIANETGFQSARSRRLGFRIDPGPASRFGVVRLEGRRQLDEAACRQAVKLAGQPYHAPALKEAKDRLQQLAIGRGFLDARVMLTDLYWDQSKRTIEVAFGIDEGKPYQVGACRFPQTTLADGELRELTGLGEGRRLTSAALSRAEHALEKHLATKETKPVVKARLEFPSLQRPIADVYFELQRAQ